MTSKDFIKNLDMEEAEKKILSQDPLPVVLPVFSNQDPPSAITFISYPEGAEWKPVSEMFQTPSDRTLEVMRQCAKLAKTNYVYVYGKLAHAFKTSKGEVWDCVNGWRNKK